MYYPNGMAKVLTDKINFLAEKTEYELYILETERADLSPFYKLSSKVKRINIDLNFDNMYKMALFKRIYYYFKTEKLYRKELDKILNQIKPYITITTLRREINFINDIKDGSKKIGEIHFNKSNYRTFYTPMLPSKVNILITKLWRHKLIKEIKRLDKFIVLTEEDKKQWTELNNVEVIYNPLTIFPKEHSNCSRKIVIAAGRYTRQKGFDMLIKAWGQVSKKHSDWHLNIYGAGDKTMYEKIIMDAKLDQFITCHNAVNNIFDKYIESSIFAFSSRFEGFGLALAEAMSCGIPSVSFSCPCGPKDIIKDGEDGFLVKNNNIDEFANKICFLIEHDERRKLMGYKAIENMKRFEQGAIMQKWINLFSNI